MSSQARPLIGIVGQLVSHERPFLKLANTYADAVLRAGGLPVVLAATGEPEDLEELCRRVDGLLLSGGDDFDTERLGLGPTHPAADPVPGAKQDLDVALARTAVARRVPLLGICYGMQLLALVGGGSLYQHLPEDRPGCQEHSGGRVHPIDLVPGTKLAEAYGLERLDVISRHHQAVAKVGPEWRINAVDEEGLIEGIEHEDHPFAVGVQWHPELAEAGGPEDDLFRAFIGAACDARAAGRPVAVLASEGF